MRYSLKGLEPDALDLALLAYILREADPFYGRTKLQKTTFLSELHLREKGLVGPHFEFYRWNNGPFSQQLWAAYDILAAKGFAYHTEPQLTRRGRELSEMVAELKRAAENRKFFEVLDAVLAHCRPRTGKQLLEEVYALRVRPEGAAESVPIREIEMGTKIIVPPTKTSLKIAHDLELLILEELEISEEEIQLAAHEGLPSIERQLVAHAMSAGQRSS